MLRNEERLVFQAFVDACPNFAGTPATWSEGNDPPDVLCVDTNGKRIGVELGEWLNEEQIARNKRLERQQNSFLHGIRSEEEDAPRNFGRVWLSLMSGLELSPTDAPQFRQELLTLLRWADDEWPNQRMWHSPQGAFLRDFRDFPFLSHYLQSVRLHPRAGTVLRGNRWIQFPNRGGPYTPKDAVDALLELLEKKTAKYADLHAREELEELYLIAYYNKALFYNSPYLAPGFGLDEVAQIASAELAKKSSAFQKVFLFNAVRPGLEVYQLWPQEPVGDM
jgi:hypothetical protein